MTIMPITTPISARYDNYRGSALKGEVANLRDELGQLVLATECHTCDNRRYVDVSSDSAVSFQSPTKVAPEQAAAAVRAHEQEHVRNDATDAAASNRDVVSQWVRLTNGICSECGKVYVSGGQTTTVTASKPEVNEAQFNAGMENPAGKKGGLLDTAA